MLVKILVLLSLLVSKAALGKGSRSFQELVQKSEALQRLPNSDATFTKLYFLDRQMVDACPNGVQVQTPCLEYLRSNRLRFWESDGFPIITTDYWLRQQRVPDPKAHGDLEFHGLVSHYGGIMEGGEATWEELDKLNGDIEQWKKKYKSHERMPDVEKLQADVKKQQALRKKNP